MKIICITQLRNEERFLPGFLHHLAPHVDGIVALDEGSTDATPDILRAEPKVISVLHERRPGPPHSHEVENRHRLIVEAARLGADWVLCGDADERFEERLLRRLRPAILTREKRGKAVLFFKIVNLWDSPDKYRLDGRSGPRWTARLFKVPESITRRPSLMHQPWFPPELDDAPRGYVPAFLYHLKMIERRDREGRFRKFTAIDPDNVHQSIGYGHLIDETGLTLRRVLPFKAYVDLPAVAWSRPPAPPAKTGCLGDADFVERFRIDTKGGRPSVETAPIREWPQLYGFDFETIFADLGTGRK
ncbi:glycosyltransferase family 2 protein [Ancylobacter sp.]|uniref:glycosyltransferase family 2 protein n=1 Tax=Ancylobacter sp. TaxID=1872567 RepID=UPI003D0C94CB